jgi:hypothetical protein
LQHTVALMDKEKLAECIRLKCKNMDEIGLKLFISSLFCTDNKYLKVAAFESLKAN